MAELGFEIHRLAKLMARERMRSNLHAYVCTVTGTHCYFIRYLVEHQDRDIFQKDLERCFPIKRSAITSALQLMEKNGLIIRESVLWDARLKKIVLTDKGLELHRQIDAENAAFEQRLVKGLTKEQQQMVLQAIQEMQQNLNESPEKREEL